MTQSHNPSPRISTHFTRAELSCPCCGGLAIAPALVTLLESIRERLGRPVRVNSAYRCADHNHAVGGVPRSQHLAGRAADIRLGPPATPMSGADRYELVAVAMVNGATGLGVYPTFLHVDVRESSPVMWRG